LQTYIYWFLFFFIYLLGNLQSALYNATSKCDIKKRKRLRWTWWACIKKSPSGETFDFVFQWSLTGPGDPWAIDYLVVLEDSRDGCWKTVVGQVKVLLKSFNFLIIHLFKVISVNKMFHLDPSPRSIEEIIFKYLILVWFSYCETFTLSVNFFSQWLSLVDFRVNSVKLILHLNYFQSTMLHK
jgi:hypothetical protein